MNKFNNSLKKLISSRNLYDRYSGILSLSDIPLFLVDTEGNILLEFIPSPDFCTHVCQKKRGEVCPDYMDMIKFNKKGKFTCQYGLENVLFPIVVDEEILGYVAGMQVYLEKNEYQKYMIDLKRFESDKADELEIVAKSISALKMVELNKLEVHQRLAGEIAKNISFDLSDNYFHQNLKRLSIEKEILEKKIIDLEAKNMSLVVNPHFLFNTLNCIARVAYFENSHTTEKLIYCLSDLLRYNLKQGNELHTIGAEINNIEKYLYIQKVRFKNRLEYEIDVAENIKSYRMPNMVILPIVENSLIHGITPKRDGGKLSIHAEEFNKEIVISIMDNGNGFSKKSLMDIKESKNKSGLGLRSTDERLKKYYGEQFGLKIVKSDYSGSTVTVTIPAQPVVR